MNKCDVCRQYTIYKTCNHCAIKQSEGKKKMSKPRVYVAGPVHGSGTQAGNIANAIRAAEQLCRAGCIPFVPHLWFMWEVTLAFMGRNDQEHWMELDITWLRQCHALVRLEGDSPGADREEAFARECGIPIFKHTSNGAARGDGMTPVRLFLAELESGRFDAHRVEQAAREGKVGIALSAANALTLPNFQNELGAWLARQPFGLDQESWQPLLGIQEEVGELSHAHLKESQGIRGSAEKHQAAARDAVGDIMVYLAGYCHARGWSLQECLEKAWGEVSKRDWAKNPHTGKASKYERTDEGEW